MKNWRIILENIYKSSLIDLKKTFVFNPVTINETSTAIKNLKNSKSVGHDGISNITLKQALSVISQPLTEVFNQCYFEEHYPEALKVARVIPIHKNGSVHDPDFNGF